MRQFKVINQLELKDGVLMCKKPSGRSFLTLDPGVGSPTICPWNGILSSDKLPRKTYGYTYHTTESVNVDITEMVIIQKK